jgi:hypothetical protein
MRRFNLLRFSILCMVAGAFTLAAGLKSVGRQPIDDACLRAGAIVFPLGMLLLLIAACHLLWQSWRDRVSARRGFQVLPPDWRSSEGK